MKGYAKCPASCGEFVQGMVGNEEYLCSYAVNLFSEVYIEERKDKKDEDLTQRINGKEKKIYIRNVKKSRLAIRKVFEKFGVSTELMKDISVKIISEIPVSKGMGSSTADIGAAIGAALDLIGETMTAEEIAEIASSIEPTDSIFMKESVIFNPVKGKVKEYIGNIDNTKVLLLEPDRYLNTVDLRKNRRYIEAKMKNRDIIENAFKMLKKGFTENDKKMIGRACTASSLANENICKKEHLKEIIEISDKMGGYGVNIAHSGTVVGIILDSDFDETEMIMELKKREIDKVYNNMYTLDMIEGGIRGEKGGIY